ncbi:PAP_central domain-containing protein [Meloidogyne graminicola]|uniref:PAP_central domain-containing protein n=1 Tax=Meloidogyne graminicola TaxID=189291 RepID=A0A8S9ZRT4_9BILA|nr:PAP_central domain-containing protein [Meloidogyne graminicola]
MLLNNYIKEESFGYLNELTIILMLTKIKLLYPNILLIELLERFFLTYLTWNLSIPIQNNNSIIVHSPTNPEELLNNNINKLTTKIIKKAMFEGLKAVHDIKNEKDQQIIINPKILFNPKKFSEMYKYFILITCYATNPLNKQNYCEFIEDNILLQLIEFIENNLKIKSFHIGKKIKYFFNYCSTWIIGIEPSIIDNNIQNNILIKINFTKFIELLKQKNLYKVENYEIKLIYGEFILIN